MLPAWFTRSDRVLNGTTISVITAPVCQLANDGQNKRLSDYVIDSAAIGANIVRVTVAVASLIARFGNFRSDFRCLSASLLTMKLLSAGKNNFSSLFAVFVL